MKDAIGLGCAYDLQTVLKLAGICGNIKLLQYLNESPTDCRFTKDIALAVAYSGNVKSVRNTINYFKHVPNYFSSILATNGDLICLQLLVNNHRFVFDKRALLHAAYFGQYNCIKYIASHTPRTTTVDFQTLKITLLGRGRSDTCTIAENTHFF